MRTGPWITSSGPLFLWYTSDWKESLLFLAFTILPSFWFGSWQGMWIYGNCIKSCLYKIIELTPKRQLCSLELFKLNQWVNGLVWELLEVDCLDYKSDTWHAVEGIRSGQLLGGFLLEMACLAYTECLFLSQKLMLPLC